MKPYLIAGAITVTLATTAAFATQPESTIASQDPLTLQLQYQNTLREWSAGLGFDVAGAIGVAGQPAKQTYRVARLEQAHHAARGYPRDQDEDSDESEAGTDTE